MLLGLRAVTRPMLYGVCSGGNAPPVSSRIQMGRAMECCTALCPSFASALPTKPCYVLFYKLRMARGGGGHACLGIDKYGG